jgi:hypothetical protein
MLKISVQCTRFEVTIVVVHVGVVKIYVAAVEALRKKEGLVKIGSNSVWHKKWCIFEFDTLLKANVLFCRFFFNPPGSGPNSGYHCRVVQTLRKTLVYR